MNPRPVCVALLALLLLAGCRDDQGPGAKTAGAESAASRVSSDGDAPEARAIVAREGDHLCVIVDLALRDKKGRKVTGAKVDVDAPESAVKVKPPVETADAFTVEVRVPASVRSLKLHGTSEGGASWTTTIATDLDSR